MTRLIALAGFALLMAGAAPAHALPTCEFQGIPLFGEVSVVETAPDVRVEVVASGADLRVQWVDRHANKCGEWRRVGLGADFRVQIVPTGGDIRIQEVTANPGLN